jgi:spore coat polysaccharide biosynthesis predicted glycosyltransferase SpsG/RimJ/RimL family protein N-acetyltransferase
VLPVGADLHVDWWVVDGYGLGAPISNGHRLLSIDDAGRSRRGGADLILDQNLGATTEPYEWMPSKPDFLLGPRYALLRREIRDAARTLGPWRDRLVVVAGGSPSASVRARVDALVAELPLGRFQVLVLDGTADLPAALDGAGLALAAAGSVSWELCHLGVPMVLFAVAPNQEPLARELARHGAAIDAGQVATLHPKVGADLLVDLMADVERRRKMAEAAASIVDGRGAHRVATRLRSGLVELRSADMDDARSLFEWANDPATRSASFTTGAIEWNDHLHWLRGRLNSSSAYELIGSFRGSDLGVVRFDVEASQAVIGVTIAPEHRGRAWAAPLIDAASRWIGRNRDVESITARVKVDNLRSQRAFLAADFDADPSGGGPAELRYARRLRGWS